MKKVLVILFFLISCKRKDGKQIRVQLEQVRIEAEQIQRREAKTILQTCIDSLHRAVASTDFKYGLILEKTKYLSNNEKLNWGNSVILYKVVPDSLKKPFFIQGPKEKRPYIIKLDSLHIDGSGAFIRLLCVNRRYWLEYTLIKKNNWVISGANIADYEAGPTDLK